MSLDSILQTIQKNFTFTKEATISEVKFELGLLKFEEEQKVTAASDSSMEPIAFYNDNRIRILSYSIKSINDEKIPNILEVLVGDKKETKERAIYLREFLETLPTKIFDELFEMYIDLKEESDKKIESKIEYKWFKTKEVRAKERDAVSTSNEENKEKIDTKQEEEKPITFTMIKDPVDTKAPEEPVA